MNSTIISTQYQEVKKNSFINLFTLQKNRYFTMISSLCHVTSNMTQGTYIFLQILR